MAHYTHLTKIKAHHTYQQSYIYANIKFEKKRKKMTTRKRESKYFMKIQQQQQINLKLYKKSKEGKTITTFYTFCVKLSDEREKKRKERTRRIKKYSR